MRLAFFGGTFDPIHRGHIAIARAAVQAYALDEVLFAPVGLQPLKSTPPDAAYPDRLAMVRIACSGEPKLAVSELDAPRADGRPNYTVNTLQQLKDQYPGAELFVIAGADSFLTLRSWRAPETLLELAQWIVVSRPGFALADRLPELGLSEIQRARVHLLETMHEEVSASELRRRLRAGEDASDWVQPPVLEYIHAHGLYGAPRDRSRLQ